MAGTMSALASCGLQRGVVRHSVTTSSRVSESPVSLAVHCSWDGRVSKETVSTSETLRNAACGLCLSLTLATALPSFAAQSNQVRLPPLSNDPDRCERAFTGNTIGQANGVADKVLDLRMCNFSNDMTNLKGKTLSSALMSDAKFDGADMTEVIMSKAYAVGASFKGTIFRNAVVDRVAFDKSDMRGVQFINTVLSGSTFEGANLEGASFEDALIGYVDIQKLCRNATLPEESRIDLACKP
ncbi:hypothetical protein M758_12G120000 [Ceratodon purpureus]|nr:hypothetical protein M758_12G120000 [Ceratodon purpureus]